MNSRSRLAAFRNFGLGMHPGYPRFQPGLGLLPPQLGPQFRPVPGQAFSLPPLGHPNPFLSSSLPLLSKQEPSSGPLNIPKYPASLVRHLSPQAPGSQPQHIPTSLLFPSLTNSLAIYSNLRLLGAPAQLPLPSPPDMEAASPPPMSIKQEQKEYSV